MSHLYLAGMVLMVVLCVWAGLVPVGHAQMSGGLDGGATGFVTVDQLWQGSQSVRERPANGAGEYAQQPVHHQSGGLPYAGLNMADNYMTGFLHFGGSAAQQSGRLSLTQTVFFKLSQA